MRYKADSNVYLTNKMSRESAGIYTYKDLVALRDEIDDARKEFSKLQRQRGLTLDEQAELKNVNELALKIQSQILLQQNSGNPQPQNMPKKGFYKNEPDSHEACSVCAASPENEEAITDDNWETCWGRNMFFCPDHRVQHPCHNAACEADMCYGAHEEAEWQKTIEAWNYDEETYE